MIKKICTGKNDKEIIITDEYPLLNICKELRKMEGCVILFSGRAGKNTLNKIYSAIKKDIDNWDSKLKEQEK